MHRLMQNIIGWDIEVLGKICWTACINGRQTVLLDAVTLPRGEYLVISSTAAMQFQDSMNMQPDSQVDKTQSPVRTSDFHSL